MAYALMARNIFPVPRAIGQKIDLHLNRLAAFAIPDVNQRSAVSRGEYLLTDKTYDKLLVKLAEKKFGDVTPELRENIVSFYAQMNTPDQHGIGPQLTALRASAGPRN